MVATTLTKIINDCTSGSLFCCWKLFCFGSCDLANPVSSGDTNWFWLLLLNVMLTALLRALLRIFIPCFLACPLSLVPQLISLIMMILQCTAGLKQRFLMVMCLVQCVLVAQVINWPHLMMKHCLAFKKPSILQHHLLLVFLTPLVILVRTYLFHEPWSLMLYVVSKPALLLNWIAWALNT